MRRHDVLLVAGWFLAGLFGTALLLTVWVQPVEAAPRPTPECWWEGTTLRAEDLPDEWSLTRTPHPTGVGERPSTFTGDFGETFTAYFWTRGGGKGLFRPGKQLNDYHPICVAVP